MGDYMRHRIFALASSILLSLALLPFPAYASGYVASKNSEIYHDPNCSYASKITKSNEVWFDSIDEAQASGRRGCYICDPDSGSTYVISSNNTSSSTKSSSDSVSSSTYWAGYDVGERAGYKKAQSEMQSQMEASIESERKDASTTSFLLTLFLVAPFASFASAYFVGRLRDKTEKQLENQITSLSKELDHVKKELNEEKERNSVLTVTPNDAAPVSLPPGVTLKASYIPVKGPLLRHRPYGDYTVYTTGGGKKYHCKYNCCCATTPIHFFQLPSSLEPCRNCVPRNMYPQALPKWYIMLTGISQGDPNTRIQLPTSGSSNAQKRVK
ncbi:MAG: Ada metal-binding domain-containing protein [Candidatus Faecousia sp.]|nr:Ada metal-binding domain-containing protein [Candidatus Faecousia sp.]